MHGINIIDVILEVDKYIGILIEFFGVWCYVIFFAIIFSETGLVVAPFLPGDSLIFILGALSATGDLNLMTVMAVLTLAAVLGNSVNYRIGMAIGTNAFNHDSRFFKKKYLIETHNFFEKHGGKTIVVSRFIPIIRTFAPFVAGISKMNFAKFSLYNITGAILWVFSITLLGYFFGNQPFIKDNFYIVVIAIIAFSILPGIVGLIATKFKSSENEA